MRLNVLEMDVGLLSEQQITAKERVVFNRPIGKNQGIQFPIARAHVNIEAADLMRFKAAAII